jgi:hypothetical protein
MSSGKKLKSKVARAKEKKARIKMAVVAVASPAGPGLAFVPGKAWRLWDVLETTGRRRVLCSISVVPSGASRATSAMIPGMAEMLAVREWYALPLYVRRGLKRAVRHSDELSRLVGAEG